tara:strand:- start:621 stop:752 length:132 start_codon:yes stop_codon:yes gene_type:complete
MMPLKICNLGFSEKVRFFLKKKHEWQRPKNCKKIPSPSYLKER